MSTMHAPVVPPSPPPTPFEVKRAKLDKFMASDKRPTSSVGDGTTAAAVREEIKTRTGVGGKWHYRKARDLTNGYKKREKDADREEKSGDISKDEADNLRKDCQAGTARNSAACAEAEAAAAAGPVPWPT
jgi:hypothetical protein